MKYKILSELDDESLIHITKLAELAMQGEDEAKKQLREILSLSDFFPRNMAELNDVLHESYKSLSPAGQEKFDRATENRLCCVPIPAQLNKDKVLTKGIRYYRLQAGLTQKALAEKIGKTPIWIAKLEGGTIDPKNITLENAVLLANALGVAPEDLLP